MYQKLTPKKIASKIFKKIRQKFVRIFRSRFLYNISLDNTPMSDTYGLDRGTAIDRYYIENFLHNNQKLIYGNCLELLDDRYTKEFGMAKVLRSDILDIDSQNKHATIIGDIRNLTDVITDNTYDCIILTQVLQFIDNLDAVTSECRRILKPGGCLLITAPAISRIDCVAGQNGDYWRFTNASMRYILQNKFKNIHVDSRGNAKIGAGFWLGLSQQDIPQSYYKNDDSNFPVLITAIAEK